MHIQELNKGPVDWDEVKQLCEDFEREIPEVSFPDYVNHGFGVITGYSHDKSFKKEVVIYYHHRIAIVNEQSLKDKEHLVSSLQGLGYHVPSQQMKTTLYGKPLVSPDEILWDELRSGRGKQIIKERLESLLLPLMHSVKDIENYRFAIYNPFIVSSTDDVIPPYIEYDEIFELPTFSNGVINFEILLEKIRTMPLNRALAISSLVGVGEGESHIPMVDFRTEDPLYEENVKDMLGRLQVPGWMLVDSGNSYHHYNPQQLVTTERFLSYLEILAQQPEIGENWPWLQAHQGFSLLRISACSKKPFFPEINDE